MGPTSTPTKSPLTCASLGNYKRIQNFCLKRGGKVDNPDSSFPSFWDVDTTLTKEELLDKECTFHPNKTKCLKEDCCKPGRPRNCSNTDIRGKEKPFKKKFCEGGKILHKNLETRACTGKGNKKWKRDGFVCISDDCCKTK